MKAQPDEEMKDEIKSVLAVTKGTSQGREEKNDDLKNLLVGNKKELLKRIEFFVSTRQYDSHLAYILIALEDAGKIVKGCEFMLLNTLMLASVTTTEHSGYMGLIRIDRQPWRWDKNES